MLNKVCVITVKVDDMDKALDFYTNILGFEVSKRYGEKIVSLKHGGHLIVLEEESRQSQGSDQGVLLGLVSYNLADDMTYLKSKGVRVLFDEPRPCPPGLYTVIQDPTGNQIELLEFTNRMGLEKVPAINHKTKIHAPAERIYEMLTTEKGWDAWFTEGTRIDLENGQGEIRFVWKNWGPDQVSAEDGGPITRAERNRCFEFQWSPAKGLVTTVHFKLEEIEDGKTSVTVTESGYDSEHLAAYMDCSTGWGEALTLLKFYLEHGITVKEHKVLER